MSRNRALEELARKTFPKEEEEARKRPPRTTRRGRQAANRPTSASSNRPTSAAAIRPRQQQTRMGLVANQGNNPNPAGFTDEDFQILIREQMRMMSNIALSD